VNRIKKNVIVGLLFAVFFTVTAVAQSPVAGATATVTQQPAEGGSGTLVPMDAPTLFKIGSFPVTNSIVLTWVVVFLIVVVVQLGTRQLRADKVPTGLQNLLEATVEGWDSLSGMILEPKVSRWVFPFAVTYFIFALISNFVDLIPGVGAIGYGMPLKQGETFASLPFSVGHVELPFIRPPTSDANLTTAMAAIFLVMTFVWALRYNGLIGSIKHVFGVKVESAKWLYPLVVLMFLFVGSMEALSIVVVRPLALAVRLYGNVYAGETLLAMTMTTKPFILGVLLSLPFYFFEIFVAVVQAFVFAMLTIVFAGTLCSHSEEEHGH
jgi:F-type H+-transporting ATPase subunit a